MKITLIITGLATGGAEMMLHKLLQNIDRSRFEPTVISLMNKGEIGPRIEALGIPVYALGMRRGLPSPLMALRLARLLRQLQPSLVHTWMYHADLLGGLAARLAGCRRVVWGIRHSNLSKTGNKCSTLAVVGLCARLSGWLPMQILSCSQRAKDVHAAVGYVDEKIHVIPNGFDLSHFAPDATARVSLSAELGLPLDAPLVGVVARYDVQKNHLGFVQAAAQLLTQMPQVHFVLAGTGVDSANVDLQTAVAAYPGLQAHMHLLGRRDDVPRLMAAFDVLASPSHGEAFPNVLGEAMACGLPCVVTDAGDSAEIVSITGRVVAVGDMPALAQQLQEVLCLPAEQRAALGQQARARVQSEYEIGHVARLYQAFYERMAAEK
ncbi:MAG: glycosyltransferase [Pseudomonadota bacterium]|nr:glycosyltransferase [Pseudomonadota bacterium]